MFRNYVIVALRNLIRKKGFSAINIIGLSIGIAAVMVIYLWVSNETGYDTFHENTDRIVATAIKWDAGGFTRCANVVPPVLAPYMVENYPEVEAAARLSSRHTMRVSHNDENISEVMIFADQSFFDIFNFPVIRSLTPDFLQEPGGVAITESAAKKYFGSEEPLGKVLTFDKVYQKQVTAVLRDFPENTKFKYDFYTKFENLSEMTQETDLDNWNSFSFETYMKLTPETNIPEFAEKVSTIFIEQDESSGDYLMLRPLTELHLYDVNGGGLIVYVRIFSFVAILVLLLACVNFMNLSTARASLRTKEIGLRKVVGASRKRIFYQFMAESMLFALISSVFALIIVECVAPLLNRSLNTNLEVEASFFIMLLPLVLVVGLLAGIYPAVIMSGMQPVHILKGKQKNGSMGFRKILVVTQFAISIGLLVCMFGINGQLNFILNKDLGFDKEGLVFVNIPAALETSKYSIRDKVLQSPAISAATYTSCQPGIRAQFSTMNPKWEGCPEDLNLEIHVSSMDQYGCDALGLELIEGRFHQKLFDQQVVEAEDTETGQTPLDLVINERFARVMNMETTVGQTIYLWGKVFNIIGIVRDYHYGTMYAKIAPLAIFADNKWNNYLAVKISTANQEAGRAHLLNSLKEADNEHPWKLSELSYLMEKQYSSIVQAKHLMSGFVSLAMIISALGLLGLASFMAERRSREIAVRKVLGASVSGLLLKLSGDFVKWVLIANIFAWPLAWMVLKNWLGNFAYQTELNLFYFLISGVAAILLALITVSSQTFRAANSNPANVLKSE